MKFFISIFLFISMSLHAKLGGGSRIETIKTEITVRDLSSYILFQNDDILHGELFGMLKKSPQVKWKYPGVEKLISFRLSSIKRIILAPSKDPVSKSANRTHLTIYLSNGDILPGILSELTASQVKIKTPYAGDILIPHTMIKKIYFNFKRGNLYQGPNSREEWMMKKDLLRNKKFTVKNSTLIIQSNSIAATEIKTTNKMTISFTLVNPQKNRRWSFAFLSNKHLFSDDFDPNTYKLRMNGRYLKLERETDDDGEDDMAQFTLPDTYLKSPLRISISIDKTARTFILSLNGKPQKKIKDPYDQFASKGSIIAFENMNSNSPLKISNISVSEDSSSTNKPGSSTEDKKSTFDSTFLSNGDKISGHLTKITDGKAIFNTDFAEMKIPVTRIREIEMSEKQQIRAKRRKGDITIKLANLAGRITVDLDSATDTTITGQSDNYGKIAIKTSYCNSLNFNIYAPPSDDAEKIQVITDDDDDEFLMDE